MQLAFLQDLGLEACELAEAVLAYPPLLSVGMRRQMRHLCGLGIPASELGFVFRRFPQLQGYSADDGQVSSLTLPPPAQLVLAASSSTSVSYLRAQRNTFYLLMFSLLHLAEWLHIFLFSCRIGPGTERIAPFTCDLHAILLRYT